MNLELRFVLRLHDHFAASPCQELSYKTFLGDFKMWLASSSNNYWTFKERWLKVKLNTWNKKFHIKIRKYFHYHLPLNFNDWLSWRRSTSVWSKKMEWTENKSSYVKYFEEDRRLLIQAFSWGYCSWALEVWELDCRT